MRQINMANVNIKSVFVAGSLENPSFHADTGHWYLSQGVVGINNVRFIQKTLLNEQSQEEQQEL